MRIFQDLLGSFPEKFKVRSFIGEYIFKPVKIVLL